MTLAEELRTVPIFADMPAEGLEWLASEMKLLEYSAGDLFVHEGERAEYMFVLLQGAIRTQPSSNGKPSWVVRAPGVAGLLPFSRMTGYPSTMRSVGVTRVAALPAGRFPEMLTRMPALQPRLISMMADRVRLATQLQDQTEKMAALGKLSAGLAHELNNPAAAARRAAANLRDAFGVFRQAVARLAAHALSAGQAAAIPDLEQELAHSAAATRQMDSLERSDCEEAVAARLEQHGVDRAWELAAVLVDAGCDAAWLDGVVARFPPSALPDLLGRLSASLTIGSLLNEIENSTSRISELVRAVKEYTHMDQGPEQEIDVHDGLEGTLLILRHRLKHGITVKLDFDRSLPKVCAQPGLDKPDRQRYRCHAGEGRVAYPHRARPRPHAGGDRRQRSGSPPRDSRPHLRALFHNERRGAGNRAGAGYCSPHRARAPRRNHGGIRTRRHALPDPAAVCRSLQGLTHETLRSSRADSQGDSAYARLRRVSEDG